jgi:hypothetical protein
MKYRPKEEKTAAITIIAIVAVLGVLRVAVITVAVTIPMQQAKAQQTDAHSIHQRLTLQRDGASWEGDRIEKIYQIHKLTN